MHTSGPSGPHGEAPERLHRVGLATGVFDLFHVGHLNLLERASERCEQLVVGVSSDELVVRLKGRRPVMPLDERVRIVGALRCVARVVTEHEDDKVALATEVGADVIIKGSDWEGSPKWEALRPRLADHGLDVVFLPYTTHVSTTELLQRVQDLDLTGLTPPAGGPRSTP